jgi:hypothetical protein
MKRARESEDEQNNDNKVVDDAFADGEGEDLVEKTVRQEQEYAAAVAQLEVLSGKKFIRFRARKAVVSEDDSSDDVVPLPDSISTNWIR